MRCCAICWAPYDPWNQVCTNGHRAQAQDLRLQRKENLVKPGDPVIHNPTGRRLTVKQVGGGAMVLCSWLDLDVHGKPVECQAAYPWEDLRAPTRAEAAEARGRERQTITAADVGEVPDLGQGLEQPLGAHPGPPPEPAPIPAHQGPPPAPAPLPFRTPAPPQRSRKGR